MDLLFDYEAYCTGLLLARRVLNSLRWMRNMLATRRYMQSILLIVSMVSNYKCKF